MHPLACSFLSAASLISFRNGRSYRHCQCCSWQCLFHSILNIAMIAQKLECSIRDNPFIPCPMPQTHAMGRDRSRLIRFMLTCESPGHREAAPRPVWIIGMLDLVFGCSDRMIPPENGKMPEFHSPKVVSRNLPRTFLRETALFRKAPCLQHVPRMLY